MQLKLRYKIEGFLFVPQFKYKDNDWQDFIEGKHIMYGDALAVIGQALASVQGENHQWFTEKKGQSRSIWFKSKLIVETWLGAVQSFYSDSHTVNFEAKFEMQLTPATE